MDGVIGPQDGTFLRLLRPHRQFSLVDILLSRAERPCHIAKPFSSVGLNHSVLYGAVAAVEMAGG
jgi:hypothetical protein